MPETTGPVQLLAVGFPAGSRFEGQIAEQLDQLESAGTIRILDFVFLHRDAQTGTLVRMDFQEGADEGLVTTLLEDGSDPDDAPHGASGAFRLTPGDIREAAAALEPGTSAGFIIFEHVWARGLKSAIAEVGGVPFAEGFLTAEAVAAMQA
jgi:Family of unknown function (DUF6325)